MESNELGMFALIGAGASFLIGLFLMRRSGTLYMEGFWEESQAAKRCAGACGMLMFALLVAGGALLLTS